MKANEKSNSAALEGNPHRPRCANINGTLLFAGVGAPLASVQEAGQYTGVGYYINVLLSRSFFMLTYFILVIY